jgi:hypothetical protein
VAISTFLLTLPLLLINGWHAYLLIAQKSGGRPESLSDHASENLKYLVIHKAVHTASSALLIVYAFTFLRAELGLFLPVILLLAGAVFDIVEVMTLKVSVSHGPKALKETHTLTAWIMGFSYMFFAVSFSMAASFNYLVVNSVWFVFIVLLLNSVRTRFRVFWLSQMSYFLGLSVFIFITHLRIS